MGNSILVFLAALLTLVLIATRGGLLRPLGRWLRQGYRWLLYRLRRRRLARERRFMLENPEAWLEQVRRHSPPGAGPGTACPYCGAPRPRYLSSLNRWECRKCGRVYR